VLAGRRPPERVDLRRRQPGGRHPKTEEGVKVEKNMQSPIRLRGISWTNYGGSVWYRSGKIAKVRRPRVLAGRRPPERVDLRRREPGGRHPKTEEGVKFEKNDKVRSVYGGSVGPAAETTKTTKTDRSTGYQLVKSRANRQSPIRLRGISSEKSRENRQSPKTEGVGRPPAAGEGRPPPAGAWWPTPKDRGGSKSREKHAKSDPSTGDQLDQLRGISLV